MKKAMYHYTSEEGHAGILRSKKILPSLKANNPKDARFGEGQYVSDILPGTKRPAQLSMIFFGIPWAGKRFTHYIAINVRGLNVISGRIYVYLIKNKKPLDITERLIKHGRN